MSPRRKVEADEPDFFEVVPTPPRRWGLPVLAAAAAVLIAAAITVSTLMLIGHEKDHRTSVNDAAALGYVREFMTAYTTLDPFNANAYADRIMAQGTGDFAKMFKEKENEILIQVARAEPTRAPSSKRGCSAGTITVAPTYWSRRRSPASRLTENRRSRAETVGLQRQSRKDSSGRSAS